MKNGNGQKVCMRLNNWQVPGNDSDPHRVIIKIMTQIMKYFVSTKELPTNTANGIGMLTKNAKHLRQTSIRNQVCYSEESQIMLLRDPHELEQANGTYWAVILTENTAQVIVDYFCQTKVFYRNKDCIEFTNAIYLFPFTKEDLDMPDLLKRMSMLDKEKLNYQPKEEFERWENMIIDPASANALPEAEAKAKELKKYYVAGKFYDTPDIKTYSTAMSTTMFKDTYILDRITHLIYAEMKYRPRTPYDDTKMLFQT